MGQGGAGWMGRDKRARCRSGLAGRGWAWRGIAGGGGTGQKGRQAGRGKTLRTKGGQGGARLGWRVGAAAFG